MREQMQIPSAERLCRGQVAVIECPEEISCDPCGTVCKFGAISMDTVNDIPQIDFDKCVGCGLCVQICPGLAIFMVGYGGDKAHVTIPYEYLPIPRKGQDVDVLNRDGEVVCRGTVLRVVGREKSIGDTPTVTVEVPRRFGMDARDILVGSQSDEV